MERLTADGPVVAALSRRAVEEWPPAVAEFTKARGASDPVAAAEVTAAELLHSYYEQVESRRLPISVRRLCDMLGIKLRGPVPRAIEPAALKASIAKPPTVRHVARLMVVNGRATIDVTDPYPASARASIAHEIGHFLIHSREKGLDSNTLSLPTTSEEEVLSEYLGRLLLLPRSDVRTRIGSAESWALACLEMASTASVSLHAVASRLFDPDQNVRPLRGVIYWKRNPKIATSESIETQLSPYWHLCPGAYIPIRRCHVLHGSLVGRIVSADGDAREIGEEDVQIGSLKGRFLVDGFSWGSAKLGSRMALSLFFEQSSTEWPPRSGAMAHLN